MVSAIVTETKHLSPHASVPVVVVSSGHVLATIQPEATVVGHVFGIPVTMPQGGVAL